MDKQELLRIIDQAAEEGWTSLDLSNKGLTELPHRQDEQDEIALFSSSLNTCQSCQSCLKIRLNNYIFYLASPTKI
jgi:hypothetical protein